MSITIETIESSLATYIASSLTGEGGVAVDIGTPESYLNSEFNNFPLVLICYKGCKPYEGMYPGILTFSIYFIEIYYNRKNLYSLMKSTFESLDNKMPIKNLNSCFKLSEGDSLYSYDGDIVIYEQQYECVEV